eukprot:352187-Chlamydomonas_euryale.AAC.2
MRVAVAGCGSPDDGCVGCIRCVDCGGQVPDMAACFWQQRCGCGGRRHPTICSVPQMPPSPPPSAASLRCRLPPRQISCQRPPCQCEHVADACTSCPGLLYTHAQRVPAHLAQAFPPHTHKACLHARSSA